MTLRISHISAGYGRADDAVHDVSLTIASGELTAVLGPSGSGKTTLLRVVAGLHRPRTGTVAIDSEDLTGLPPERRNIGLVPQDGALFGHMSVAANVAYGLPGVRGHRSAARHPRVRELLALVGLSELAGRMPHELSGGQQQRVALARALAPHPRLILMDEPFSALDASLRDQLRHEVADLLRQLRITSVLITHDQTEALSMADHLVVMCDGRVVQTGSPGQIYRQPNSSWVATFVGDANLLPYRERGPSGAATAIGTIELNPGGPDEGLALLRPEQIALAAANGTGADGQPCGAVVDVQYFGHDRLMVVEMDGDPGCRVMVRSSTVEPIRTGARVRVVPIDRAHPIAHPAERAATEGG